MTLRRRTFLRLTAGAAAMPVAPYVARAQAYPSRPVRWIVPSPPGGALDSVTRLMGQWLTERLGQAFVIENRPGGSNNIGTEAVVRAAPDGHTLLLAATANSINATLYDKLNFNFMRDITAVACIVRVPNVMVVHPSVPAATDSFPSKRYATASAARQRPQPDGENFGGEVSLASSSLIVLCTRVNGRGRATRAWIDRTNDGLSGCPPTASACRQKGTSARPVGAARRLGYINGATSRKGA